VPARILAWSPLRQRLRVRHVRGPDFPLIVWAVRRDTPADLAPVSRALDQALIERLSGRGQGPARDQ
jgi:hypothetical protein